MAVKQIIQTLGNAFDNGAATRYYPFMGQNQGWTSFEFLTATGPWSVSGTFKNLVIVMAAPPAVGKTYTYILRKNGVDTAVQVAIAYPAVSGSDLTHSVSIAPGDRLVLKGTTSGVSSYVVPLMSLSVEFDGNNPGESGYCTTTDNNSTGVWNTAPNWYVGIGSGLVDGNGRVSSQTGAYNTTAAPARTWEVIAVTGAVTRYDILGFSGNALHACGAGKSMNFALLKNEVVQDGSGGTVDTRATLSGASATTVAWTGNLPVAPGDTLRMRMSPVNFVSSDAIDFGISWCLTASTDGDFQLPAKSGSGINSAGITFNPAGMGEVSGWSSTENIRQVLNGPTPFYVKGFLSSIAPDAPSPAVRSVSVRVAGVTQLAAQLNNVNAFVSPAIWSLWVACSSVAGAVQIPANTLWTLILQFSPFPPFVPLPPPVFGCLDTHLPGTAQGLSASGCRDLLDPPRAAPGVGCLDPRLPS